MMRRISVLAAACLSGTLLALTPSAPVSAGATSLTVLGPLVTLKAGDATPAGPTSASVTAAQNEFESFQVAIEADATGIGNLKVDLAGDLTGAHGGTLPASAFTLYREQYFHVSADHLSDGESTVGDWPDALVPEVDPIYGQARSLFNQPVPANGRAVLWVDVLASQSQAPDTYTGALRVKDGATVLGTVPVSVTVRNFAIPSTSSLDNVFLTEPVKQCQVHTGSGTCNGDAVEANRLSAVYERVALENRMTISTPWQVDRGAALSGAMLTQWRAQVKPIVNGTAAPASVGSPIRLPGAKATRLVLWHYCAAACLDSWKSQATTDGFADRLTYYSCDEPNQDAGNWAACNAAHTVAQSRGMRELVTTPIPYAQGAGGGAESWIDDMVVLARMMDGRSAPFAGNQRPSYDAWTAANGDGQANKVWLYDSCEQAACNNPGDAGWNSSFYDGWPGYGIDQPASQARAMPWEAFVYGATGELYWGVDYRLGQAWNACGAGGTNCLYESGMNGDATLFYPGKACTPGTAAGCIGGTTDIPIESIRLKRLRDGREDYEYLKLAAADPGTAGLASTTALNLLGGDIDQAAFSATFSQSALNAARNALGDALDQPVAPPSGTFSIGDAQITEGTGADPVMTFTVTGAGEGSGSANVRAVTASAGAKDFALLDTSVTMTTHETRQVRVRITGDRLHEADEVFHLQLYNPTGVGLGDAAGNGTILDDDPAVYRPDAEVRLGSNPYVGNDVYGTDGVGQTVLAQVKRGVTRTFTVRVTNDGNLADNWSLAEAQAQVTGMTRTWTYGSTDVTPDVRDGTFSLLKVPVGISRRLVFTVTPGATAPVGQVSTWYLHAVHNPLADGIRDVVRIQVKVVS